MEDLESIIMKIKQAKGEELIPLLRNILNVSITTKSDLMETLQILIHCLKEGDELVRNTAIEVLEYIVLSGVLESFLAEEHARYLFDDSGGEAVYSQVKNSDLNQINSDLEIEHPEVHDFADFVVDFHHEEGVKRELPKTDINEETVDENYLKFMKKREKYIDLWDFEIPEE